MYEKLGLDIFYIRYYNIYEVENRKMKTEYNSMSFSREAMKEGLHLELIKYLVNYHLNNDYHFNDVHITTDGETLIVEWEQVPYDHSFGGSFQYVEEDCLVMRDLDLPDGGNTFIPQDDDPEEYLKEWLNEHPGWKRSDYGHWVFEDKDK